MFNSLSGRFLILTTIFVMLAEVLIFVPSVARFRESYLLTRLERAQIASLAALATEDVDPALEEELLLNAGVYNVVLRRDEARQLMLSSPLPSEVETTYDLRDATAFELIVDALTTMVQPHSELVRVIGSPSREAGLQIEVTMHTAELRTAMVDYGLRILALSAVISVLTAFLLFLAVRRLLVRPIKGVVGHMQRYADAPEDAGRIIRPTATVRELREAEDALAKMQTELTQALRQKERLAQLGGAVARVSHDLRNILTSAQLFTDRIETSEDPIVSRLAPKLVNSIARAVSLCESTLAFGRAEEPAPVLTMVNLAAVVDEVLEAEHAAIGDADISLAAEVPPHMRLRADPEQLHRILSNLVRNARQALIGTSAPGEITVRGHTGDDHWIIEVADNGPGLPPKARENLFKPFQGGVRKGGSGLGLAIVSELVRGHGGRLDLKETGDAGTTFIIRLPMGAVEGEQR